MFKQTVPKKVYRKVKKVLLVDSRDRSPTQTQSRYSVSLPKTYENVYSIALRSAEIPVTWYTFAASKDNTSFTLTYNGTDYIVVIPDGNYDSTSFITVLAGALNDAVNDGDPFTVTYSSETFKITIATTNTQAFTLTFPGSLTRPTFWGLGYYMGFLNRSYTSNGSYSLTPDNQLQLNVVNYILMEIDFLNKEDQTTGLVEGYFAKIPIASSPGSICFYQEVCVPMNRSVMSPPVSQIKTLTIKFKDYYGNFINFNNVDHSLTIEFELLDNNFDEYSSMDFAAL